MTPHDRPLHSQFEALLKAFQGWGRSIDPEPSASGSPVFSPGLRVELFDGFAKPLRSAAPAKARGFIESVSGLSAVRVARVVMTESSLILKAWRFSGIQRFVEMIYLVIMARMLLYQMDRVPQ